MAAIDQRTQTEFSIPGTLLMEDAGTKAWLLLRRDYGGDVPSGRVVVLAGKGNNGGDGFVMARQAAVDGVRQLTVVLAGGRPAESGDAGRMLAACQSLPMETLTWPEQADSVRSRLEGAELVLDCIAGNWHTRSPEGAAVRPRLGGERRLGASRGYRCAQWGGGRVPRRHPGDPRGKDPHHGSPQAVPVSAQRAKPLRRDPGGPGRIPAGADGRSRDPRRDA